MSSVKTSRPYNDKFDESKNYQHILFRNGSNVVLQSGELNEVQSMLSNHIQHVAEFSVKNNSITSGGTITVQQIQINVLGRSVSALSTTPSSQVIGVDGHKVATVVGVDSISSNGINEPILNKYNTYKITVSSGVLFRNGKPINFEEQHFIIFDELSDSYKTVGFDVVEEVVTEFEDVSLYSNANGYPNIRQPGAHRLRYKCSLKDIGSISGVPLLYVNSSNYHIVDNGSSKLYDILEKRTFEESGHYFIHHPTILFKEQLYNPDTGFYGSRVNGDPRKIDIQISPLLGYVFGKRIEHNNMYTMVVDKPSSTDKYNNTFVNVSYTNYISVTPSKGIPYTTTLELTDLNFNVIGECYCKDFKSDSGNKWILFVTDITKGSWSSVKIVRSKDRTFQANVDTVNVSNPEFIDVPYNNVSSISDISIVTNHLFEQTSSSEAKLSLTIPTGRYFSNQLFDKIVVSYLNKTTNQYTLIPNINVGVQYITPSNIMVTLPSYAASSDVRINIGVNVNNVYAATSDRKVASENIQFNSSNPTVSLKYVDVSGVKILLSGQDISGMFTVVHNTTNKRFKSDSLLYVGTQEFKDVLLEITYEYQDIVEPTDVVLPSSFNSIRSTIGKSNSFDYRYLNNFVKPYPMHNSQIICDVEVYLNIGYSIVMDSFGSTYIKVGGGVDEPIYPNTEYNEVKLFDFNLIGYKPNNNVQYKSYLYPRYTMSQLNLLDERLSNVEDAIRLNAIEYKASNIELVDNITGGMMYKVGFVASDFKDSAMFDIDNSLGVFGSNSFGLLENVSQNNLSDCIADTSLYYDQNKQMLISRNTSKVFLTQPLYNTSSDVVKSSDGSVKPIVIRPNFSSIGQTTLKSYGLPFGSYNVYVNNVLVKSNVKSNGIYASVLISYDRNTIYPAVVEFRQNDVTMSKGYIYKSKTDVETQFEPHKNSGLMNTFVIKDRTMLTKIGLFFTEKPSSGTVTIGVKKYDGRIPIGEYLTLSTVSHENILSGSIRETVVTFDYPAILESGSYVVVITSDTSGFKMAVLDDRNSSIEVAVDVYMQTFNSGYVLDSKYTQTQYKLSFMLYNAIPNNASDYVKFKLPEMYRTCVISTVANTKSANVKLIAHDLNFGDVVRIVVDDISMNAEVIEVKSFDSVVLLFENKFTKSESKTISLYSPFIAHEVEPNISSNINGTYSLTYDAQSSQKSVGLVKGNKTSVFSGFVTNGATFNITDITQPTVIDLFNNSVNVARKIISQTNPSCVLQTQEFTLNSMFDSIKFECDANLYSNNMKLWYNIGGFWYEVTTTQIDRLYTSAIYLQSPTNKIKFKVEIYGVYPNTSINNVKIAFFS